MDHERRARWNAIYDKYRKVMDEWPSLFDDPEAHRAAWKEIHRYANELERLLPAATDPLPRHAQ